MIKRIAGCAGIFERLKASRSIIGLKSFEEVPTEQAKIEQLPICFMNYGEDVIVKRSSRTMSPTRKGNESTRELEIIFEFIAKEPDNVMEIYSKAKEVIFSDIHPAIIDGDVVQSVYIKEERTEGPVGYGIPKVKAFIFVVKLVYPDTI